MYPPPACTSSAAVTSYRPSKRSFRRALWRGRRLPTRTGFSQRRRSSETLRVVIRIGERDMKRDQCALSALEDCGVTITDLIDRADLPVASARVVLGSGRRYEIEAGEA